MTLSTALTCTLRLGTRLLTSSRYIHHLPSSSLLTTGNNFCLGFQWKLQSRGRTFFIPFRQRSTDSSGSKKVRRSMKERTRDMSAKTRKSIRETRAVVKDKMDELRENVITYPNGLCALRIILTPFLGYCVIHHHYITSLSLFMVAGITDLMDGYIARNFPNQKSKLGSVLDPVADKFLIATALLTLTIDNLIPLPLTILIISRDVILVTWSGVIRYQSISPPKSLAKYFDLTMPTAEIKPTLISKGNTFLQLTLIFSTLASPVFPSFVGSDLLRFLWYSTTATTVFSGLDYLRMRGSYRLIKREKRK